MATIATSRTKNLYQLHMEELESRKAAFTNVFPPFFSVAFGSHILNVANKASINTDDRLRDEWNIHATTFYYESKRQPDLRCPPFQVMATGMGKTYWIELYLDGQSSLLGCIQRDGLKTGLEEQTTGAGWSGQLTRYEGDVYETPGLAKEYMCGIIGFEEFSAITAAMQAAHSKNLETALLTSLDSGRVRKKVGPGHIEYLTHVTPMSGTQPARLDTSQGLGRRLILIRWVAGRAELQELRAARRRARNVAPGDSKVFHIERIKAVTHDLLDYLWTEGSIRAVEISADLDSFLDQFEMPHYEEALFERMAMGYNLVIGNYDETLQVDMDNELERILTLAYSFRQMLKRGGELDELFVVLEEADGHMVRAEFCERMTVYGYSWDQTIKLIREGERLGVIKTSGNNVLLHRDTNNGKSAIEAQLEERALDNHALAGLPGWNGG